MVRDVGLAAGGQVLQRIEPAAPPVLGIAKHYPRADDPDDIGTREDQRKPMDRGPVLGLKEQVEPKQALDHVQHCRDETQQDDVQAMTSACGPRGGVSMEFGDMLDEGCGDQTPGSEDEVTHALLIPGINARLDTAKR